MTDAARALGWEYLGIADHSRSAAYAGGLTRERLKEQSAEIDAINAATKKPLPLYQVRLVEVQALSQPYNTPDSQWLDVANAMAASRST